MSANVRTELQDLGSQAVAALAWALLGFGLLFLFSATSPDSGWFYDSMRRTTVAWIGVALLLAAQPLGVAAFMVDPPHRRAYAPGEHRAGIRHRVLLATSLAASAVLAATLAVALAV